MSNKIQISKSKKLFYVIISSFLLVVAGYMLFVASSASAAEGYKLEVPLPPLPGTNPESGIAGYIQYLYVFAIALAGFLALGSMVYGGLQYVLAAGNVAKVEDAKDIITQALWGLGLVLVSYLLLRTINPDLVSLTNPTLKPPTIKGALNISPSAPQLKVSPDIQAFRDAPIGFYGENDRYIVHKIDVNTMRACRKPPISFCVNYNIDWLEKNESWLKKLSK